MQKIYLSDHGPELSAAVYGFWRWYTPALVSQKRVSDIVHYNLELGVNTFDHSNYTADGKIEELFGNVISESTVKREDLVISTKAGIRKLNGTNKVYYDLSAEYITASVEQSLKRLKTDYIDVFLLEHCDALYRPEETASALISLQRSGKIKHIGVSGFNVFQHRLLASFLNKPIVTNHIELNLIKHTAISDGRLDFIREQYSKPLAFSPLAGGKIISGTDKKHVALRKVLAEIADAHSSNIEQVAVAWLYKLGALPIIGSPDKERIRNAASAHALQLSQEEWYRLYTVAK